MNNIDKPYHYTQGNIETIDKIEDTLTPEEFKGYLKGNIFKYLSRARYKGGAEDIAKAKWYMDRLAGLEVTHANQTQ